MSNGLLTGIDPRPTEHWAGVVLIDHILPVCTLARFEPVKPNCLVFNKPRFTFTIGTLTKLEFLLIIVKTV